MNARKLDVVLKNVDNFASSRKLSRPGKPSRNGECKSGARQLKKTKQNKKTAKQTETLRVDSYRP